MIGGVMEKEAQQDVEKYSMQIDSTSALNLVLQQNSVALIREILLSSKEVFSSSRIIIRSNPEY